MSAIAEILAGTGHQVSGSDLTASVPLQRLVDRGLVMHVGHDARHIADAEIVAVSTAIPATNPEVVAAVAAGVPVLRRAELLTAITAQWRTVAVAGTHGKTTTAPCSPLCSSVPVSTRPSSSAVTSRIRARSRGRHGRGPRGRGRRERWHVRRVGRSGGHRHQRRAGPPRALRRVRCARAGLRTLRGTVRRTLGDLPRRSGGRSACRIGRTASGRHLRHRPPGRLPHRRTAADAGRHRVHDTSRRRRLPDPAEATRNAQRSQRHCCVRNGGCARAPTPTLSPKRSASSAVSAVGSRTGARPTAFVSSTTTRTFRPRWHRRSTPLGSRGPDRLVAVFQPHRYSRTEQLWSTFGDAFVDADVLVVTGLYSAGERPRGRYRWPSDRQRGPAAPPRRRRRRTSHRSTTSWRPGATNSPGDLCITLGAGDLTHLPDGAAAARRPGSGQDVAAVGPESGRWSAATVEPLGRLEQLRTDDPTQRVVGAVHHLPGAAGRPRGFLSVASVTDLEMVRS